MSPLPGCLVANGRVMLYYSVKRRPLGAGALTASPLLLMDLFVSALAQLTPEAIEQHLPLDEPNRPWVICTAGPWQLTTYAVSDGDAETDWFESDTDKAAVVRFDLFPVGLVVSIRTNGLELGRSGIWGVWLDHRDCPATYSHVLDLLRETAGEASHDVAENLGRKIADLQHAADVLVGLEPAYATTVNF